MDHQPSWQPIQRRPLTREEKSWVQEIISKNAVWSDVFTAELFAIAKCACGFCRAIQLEPPTSPQNPRAREQGQIGDIDISTSAGDAINIALYAKDGSLTDLDVLCDFGSKPVPESWKEIARRVDPQ